MNKICADEKVLLILEGCLGAAGIAVCAYYEPKSAVVLFIFAAATIIAQTIVFSKRRKKLSRLCDKIDLILHNNEEISLEEFKEGELGILSSEIHKMTIKLREQNNALKSEKLILKESLEDISHQLRTPLTTILVILGTMRGEQSQKEREEHISNMFTLLSKMQWLLETLLSISRLDAGAVTFKKERAAVSEIVNNAIIPLSIAIELKDIALSQEISEGAGVFADKMYMTEALENILKNCMEHTPEGGAIKISAQENNIYTEIVISDTGAGIPEEELSRVFERFYRGKGFSSKGYGIGLAFAKKIAASQNGTLTVKNGRNGGAVFEMRIYKQGV